MTRVISSSWEAGLEWARKYEHNDLFRPGPIFELNACVGLNGGPYGLDDYAIGYFKAADRLATSLLKDPSYSDVIIYPLVFVYRHALELSLKYLATVLPRIWDEAEAPEMTHRLLDNWNIVRRYLVQDEAFDSAISAEQVDKILRDFSEVDPSGEAFRFPQARTGVRFLERTSHINVEVFVRAMKFVEEAFTFWMLVADAEWAAKCDSAAG